MQLRMVWWICSFCNPLDLPYMNLDINFVHIQQTIGIQSFCVRCIFPPFSTKKYFLVIYNLSNEDYENFLDMICKGDYYSTALKFVKVEGMDAWGVWEACRWKRTFAHSVADSSLFCTKVYSPYYCLFEMYLSSLYDKGSRYCDSNGLLFLFVLQEKSDELYWIYFHWTYLFFVVFYSFRCQEDGKYTLFFAPLFIDEISIDAYKPPVSIFNDSIFLWI